MLCGCGCVTMAARRLADMRLLCMGFGVVVVVIYLLAIGKTNRYYPLVWSSPERERWKPRKVILFSYGRSGSSFTGDVIYHSPDVYYVYEPLKEISSKNESAGWKMNKMLHALLSCEFSTPLLSKITRNFLKRSEETELIL
ncbi:hypothetical protein BaRGS_00023088, partial [Batillaria attramentaria]